MAVVPMKRISVVASGDVRQPLLGRLQEEGVLHVVPLVEVEELPSELSGRLAALRRIGATLAQFDRAQVQIGSLRMGERGAGGDVSRSLSDEELNDHVERLLARKTELEGRLVALAKEEEAALPWGETTSADVVRLAEAGFAMRTYRVRQDRLGDLQLPSDLFAMTFPLQPGKEGQSGGKSMVGLLVGRVTGDDAGELDLDLDTVEPAGRPISLIRAEKVSFGAELAELKSKLQSLSERATAALEREQALISDRLALAKAQSSCGGDDQVWAVTGWVPTHKVPSLKKVVLKHGGAMMVADPSKDDEPPIELRNGPVARFFEPLLKAFQLPNYREADPTLLIAPFMGLFFGFCLGDAGYGLALFLVATLMRWKLKIVSGEGNKAMRLLQTLGLITLVVGLLLGNLFGLKLYESGFVTNLGLDRAMLFSSLSSSPERFFYASLLFGVVQLSFGIVIRLLRNLQLGDYQKMFASLGWLTIFPGVALWYMKGSPILFFVALGLVFLFNAPGPKLGRRLGGGAWALYNVTGLFGDVMSYARIFGLGLSSGIIAQVVNIIAMQVVDVAPVVGWIGALLILVLGHSFNFAMAVIGSLVHPARLQFLEFFGKFFEGGGEHYRPFQKFTKGG